MRQFGGLGRSFNAPGRPLEIPWKANIRPIEGPTKGS